MRKVTTAVIILLALAPVLVCAPARGQEEFRFYGLDFGMTRAEVNAVMPLLPDNLVRQPAYGMSSLAVVFDAGGRLIEIQASYPRPAEPLRTEGLRRALRERFVLPVHHGSTQVSVDMDEYANRAAFTLVFRSKTLREENIERYKDEYLLEMGEDRTPASP